MKYPDINIQIKYPNKLINADTPKLADLSSSDQMFTLHDDASELKLHYLLQRRCQLSKTRRNCDNI